MSINRRVVPDRIVMRVPGLSPVIAAKAAQDAVYLAQRNAPKLTGRAASLLVPFMDDDVFGFSWPAEADYLWYQNEGITAFTMRSLANKTIPMWIDDPTGAERQKYPKAKTRVTESGKVQVLIFRRAARIGATKMVGRKGDRRRVPASYPGAPGRIARREAGAPLTTAGRLGGRIATGNVGVRWRHPGLAPRSFMQDALHRVAAAYGLSGRVEPGYGAVVR